MAVKLTGKSAPTKEARDILLCQIDEALPALRKKRVSDSRIHDARKQIKAARATLRLIRKALPKAQYRSENRCLRDAARPLSEARDTAVLLKAFNDLFDGAPTFTRTDGSVRFGRRLTKDRSTSRQAVARRGGLAQTRRLLQGTRSRAAHWHISGKGWSVLGAGLKQVFSRARQALEAARATPSDTALHEWRKQTKYLRHQLMLLRPIHPHRIDALADDLHQLSDYLGDDHDLAVLRGKLELNSHLFEND
ncbi:MAG TPA: CHAD domain-containing protein, partial [Acidobacteriaceae bacterium]|nr:CHAD domain-containing protein [Acidobacteriaceae bacterium]